MRNLKDLDTFVAELLPYDCHCLCGHGESCHCCNGTYGAQLKSQRENLKEKLGEFYRLVEIGTITEYMFEVGYEMMSCDDEICTCAASTVKGLMFYRDDALKSRDETKED